MLDSVLYPRRGLEAEPWCDTGVVQDTEPVLGGSTSDEPRGPSGLEIKSACDAIYIEDFASEMQAGHDSALHGAEIDLTEGDAPAGDKLFFEGGFSSHEVRVIEQAV